MAIEEGQLHTNGDLKQHDGLGFVMEIENSDAYSTPRHSSDKGDAALCFLDINPPLPEAPSVKESRNSNGKQIANGSEGDTNHRKDLVRESGVTEFISPEGEVFICNTDLEAGFDQHQNTLISLGCSCKNDLALAHYACALKWFVNHGSTICEICGRVATNVRPSDFKKVVVSLKDYEALMEKTASGEPTSVCFQTNSGIDPDAIAGIRRQRLSEIALWFNPNYNSGNNANHNNSSRISQGVAEQPSSIPNEDAPPTENTLTKWAVEGTGILVATGLLTVTLAWLIAPRVGKKTAKNGLHILLGGICALTVVVFLRFVILGIGMKTSLRFRLSLSKSSVAVLVIDLSTEFALTTEKNAVIVLSRIKYGPARYWAILFVFWFLVFGIWASRTHGSHSS
ncbi:hypothetical protein Scep_002686 [Stephania cephalantha]|uniref:RING-CH-type domain-containing protein n=1 Tax=Stephania cephalantha TaxID=152367 RepID=A0AAP0LBH0_9MAGN